MLWFESRKKLSGGLNNVFLSVLGVLQVETAKYLYLLERDPRASAGTGYI